MKATGETAKQIWDKQSPSTKLASRPKLWIEYLASLSRDKGAALRNNWAFWGRPAQQIPAGVWFVWLLLAGRAWGKSKTGAHFAIRMARDYPGSRGALVGSIASEVRDVMIGGDSGIIPSSPPDFIPIYEPSKRKLTWPNGSYALCYTADSPDRLRGPNLAWAWCDELGAWRYPQEAWDMLMFCLRKLARHTDADGKVTEVEPRVCVTTTPRPIELILNLVKENRENPRSQIVVTRGPTWDNFLCVARNYFRQIIQRARGGLARQEIWAELVENIEGALWNQALLDKTRLKEAPACERIGIGVDPSEGGSDEIGIVAMGRSDGGHGFVLADESLSGKPHEWGRKVLDTYFRLEADFIAVEINRGGDMCASVIRSQLRPGEEQPRIIEVRATKGKATRAEPISGLWEMGLLHMVGIFAYLEDQMRSYVPGVTKKSPDRMDAMVWVASVLFNAVLSQAPTKSKSVPRPLGW